MRWLALFCFSAMMPIANWLIGNVGTTCIPNGPCLIPVGLDLMAPSGVLVIGLALVLRDWLQLSGREWPFASVDSTDIGRNHNRDQNTPRKMADRWDAMQCPGAWEETERTPTLPLGAA